MEALTAAHEHLEDFRSDPSFARSLNPMLVVDGERRSVDANAAACLFLRQSADAIRKLRLDDLTTPNVRSGLDATWSEFLQGTFATSTTPWELQTPDAARIPVDLRLTRNYRPGLHLAVVLFAGERVVDERSDDHAVAPPNDVLTKREREVLTLVAVGNTGVEIAHQLFLSPATVATHVTNALLKLGAKNRAHGITLALQANELELDPTADRIRP